MNKTTIKNKLKQESFVPSKKMGQNFLLSKEIKNKIVNSANVDENDIVFEVGPGFGAITEILVKKAKKVIAVELDKRLFHHTKEYIKADNFLIINSDILDVDIDKLLEAHTNNQKVKMVANLPYSISSKIILKVLKSQLISDAYIMVQKEMAERISAKVNTSGYNAFTVFVQLFAQTKMLFKVSAKEFIPAPKVESAVIHIHNNFEDINFDVEKVEKFLRICFLNKRKKLSNNLFTIYDKNKVLQMFETLKIDLNTRAENIDPKKFLEIFNFLKNK